MGFLILNLDKGVVGVCWKVSEGWEEEGFPLRNFHPKVVVLCLVKINLPGRHLFMHDRFGVDRQPAFSKRMPPRDLKKEEERQDETRSKTKNGSI